MKIRLKTQPADFIVEEETSLPIRKKGLYAVYLLEKTGWNTVDALFKIAEGYRVPFRNFSYGGKKDRHARTAQYVTFKGRKLEDVRAENYSLTFCGWADQAMGPQFIAANRFQIVVRKLTALQAETALSKAHDVAQSGYMNYFDDQRFGSYDALQGFIAEKLLKGHLNGALKTYLTAIHSEDKRPEKERRKFFYDHWKDWPACLAAAKTEFERQVFEHLVASPKDVAPLLNEIPREMMNLYISAYQSFLWNELVRRFVLCQTQVTGRAAVSCYPGVVGDYLFLPGVVLSQFAKLVVPLPAALAKMPNRLWNDLYKEVLAANGLTKNMFEPLPVREVCFKPSPRPVVVVPQDLEIQKLPDELNEGRTKLVLSFKLPRGTYATMFVKNLFNVPWTPADKGESAHVGHQGQEV